MFLWARISGESCAFLGGLAKAALLLSPELGLSVRVSFVQAVGDKPPDAGMQGVAVEGYDEDQTTQLSTSYTTAFYLLTHHKPPSFSASPDALCKASAPRSSISSQINAAPCAGWGSQIKRALQTKAEKGECALINFMAPRYAQQM